jgi:hypothetical protein
MFHYIKADAEFLPIRHNPRDTCDEGTSIARICERKVRLNMSLLFLAAPAGELHLQPGREAVVAGRRRVA